MIVKTTSGACYFIFEDGGETFIKRSANHEVYNLFSGIKKAKDNLMSEFTMSLRAVFLSTLNCSGSKNTLYRVKGSFKEPMIGKSFEFSVHSNFADDVILTSPVTEILN